jgi:hypothetical protein
MKKHCDGMLIFSLNHGVCRCERFTVPIGDSPRRAQRTPCNTIESSTSNDHTARLSDRHENHGDLQRQDKTCGQKQPYKYRDYSQTG